MNVTFCDLSAYSIALSAKKSTRFVTFLLDFATLCDILTVGTSRR
nr:MAG TPA: hypothetical protein [Caudoviricetes sp.]DAG67488.1 MAG TPA: hypothetical protein [Caudoviricetes sp.]